MTKQKELKNIITLTGMNTSEIQRAIDLHCPRRARHLCEIYAEIAGGTEEDTEHLYEELKTKFGLDKLK